MERKVIEKFYHEHPLILTDNVSDKDSLDCYGCGDPVTNLESAYVCMHQQSCSNRIILHSKCGELPDQISHHKHPHPLDLFDYHATTMYYCDLCRRYFGKVLGYHCSICRFDIDIKCEKLGIDALIEEKKEVKHPSHPSHPLTLMRKPAFAFYCDGCGAQDVDMAFICSTCEFWVHKSCASLPLILPVNRQLHHHHQLSLAFSFPAEHQYEKFRYQCDVCDKDFDMTCWLYFCGYCRFFAHIKCVTSTTRKQDLNLGQDDNDGSNVIEFPLYAHDISKELITPFVMREKGLKMIPDVKAMPTTVKMAETTANFSFLFNYHNHPLSLVAQPHDDKKIMPEEDEDEDEATNDKLKICDVCVTPISSPYYECAPCKYFVHSICYLLPKTFSSSSSPDLYGECPKTHDKNHEFTLYISSRFKHVDTRFLCCNLCGLFANGMMYECQGCKMKIDVKCASLPTSIRHASHAHHKRLVLNRIPSEGGKMKMCHCCDDMKKIAYCCSSDDCDFVLDLKCAMLPASIAKPEWDNHPLILSFDASLDHPSDFICDLCEVELHPKRWMYHCRQCDLSFHLDCLRTASGWFRNIKFGRRFVLDEIHPNHPLTFNCVTIKRRCDLCSRKVYNYCGLECASCYYVVCIRCATRKRDIISYIRRCDV